MTHVLSGEFEAVAVVSRTTDLASVDSGSRQQPVDARSTDAVSALGLARLSQRRRAADAQVAGVHLADELHRRRADETVEVGVHRQARQLDAGHCQRTHP